MTVSHCYFHFFESLQHLIVNQILCSDSYCFSKRWYLFSFLLLWYKYINFSQSHCWCHRKEQLRYIESPGKHIGCGCIQSYFRSIEKETNIQSIFFFISNFFNFELLGFCFSSFFFIDLECTLEWFVYRKASIWNPSIFGNYNDNDLIWVFKNNKTNLVFV